MLKAAPPNREFVQHDARNVRRALAHRALTGRAAARGSGEAGTNPPFGPASAAHLARRLRSPSGTLFDPAAGSFASRRLGGNVARKRRQSLATAASLTDFSQLKLNQLEKNAGELIATS